MHLGVRRTTTGTSVNYFFANLNLSCISSDLRLMLSSHLGYPSRQGTFDSMQRSAVNLAFESTRP